MIKIQDTGDMTPFKFVNIYRPFSIAQSKHHTTVPTQLEVPRKNRKDRLRFLPSRYKKSGWVWMKI